MIRFLHASDSHIDSPLKGLNSYEGAPVDTLRSATRRAFQNLVQLAIDENVDFMVIAGDIYDGDWKDYSTGLFFRGEMAKLKQNGISVYIVAGNHDAASVISKRLNLPDNVHVFSTRTTESLEVVGHPVIIHGRGFPNRAVPENFAKEYPVAVPNRFNIGLLHTSLTGRTGHDIYSPCSEADLRQKGYGYWALGHIHQPEVISKEPWIVFSGNCQGRDIRESGERGCFLVTISDSFEVLSVDFHNIDVVRWQTLDIDLTGMEYEEDALNELSQSIASAVNGAEGRLVAARIIFKGATKLHGSFHREISHWRAQILGIAQDYGEELVWIEKLKILTTPIYDLKQLAQRDLLTKIVLETIEHAKIEPKNYPSEIKEMLGVLPNEIRKEVEEQFFGDNSTALLEDVRSIILDALGAKGGNSYDLCF